MGELDKRRSPPKLRYWKASARDSWSEERVKIWNLEQRRRVQVRRNLSRHARGDGQDSAKKIAHSDVHVGEGQIVSVSMTLRYPYEVVFHFSKYMKSVCTYIYLYNVDS